MLPLGQPYAGRTRPRQVDVPLPVPPRVARPPAVGVSDATGAAVAELHRSMTVITSLHNIFWVAERGNLDQQQTIDDMREVLAALREQLVVWGPPDPAQHTYAREIGHYHLNLERAFGLALGVADAAAAAAGRPLAGRVIRRRRCRYSTRGSARSSCCGVTWPR